MGVEHHDRVDGGQVVLGEVGAAAGRLGDGRVLGLRLVVRSDPGTTRVADEDDLAVSDTAQVADHRGHVQQAVLGDDGGVCAQVAGREADRSVATLGERHEHVVAEEVRGGVDEHDHHVTVGIAGLDLAGPHRGGKPGRSRVDVDRAARREKSSRFRSSWLSIVRPASQRGFVRGDGPYPPTVVESMSDTSADTSSTVELEEVTFAVEGRQRIEPEQLVQLIERDHLLRPAPVEPSARSSRNRRRI